jgi:pilus assembly protein Flp/PilA
MAETHTRPRPRSFIRDNSGAVAVEYTVLLMMVGVALIGMMSLTDVSSQLSNTFNFVANAIAGK